jgi:hypothetical protein
MMASGRAQTTSNLLQGNLDTGFKSDKRTTLGSVKSLTELEERLQTLSSNQHKILEHVQTNLKIVLMGAGYAAPDAALLAHDSPLLRISCDSQAAYIGLHMHLYGVGLQHGWEHVKTELMYHVKKLREIRTLHQTRLQVIAYNYCYLRDLQLHRWQTFEIQDLRIRELQAMAFVSPGGGVPAPTGRTHFCNHCKSSLHPGNKASCFWKSLSATAAKQAAATAARKFGTEDPILPGLTDMEEIP